MMAQRRRRRRRRRFDFARRLLSSADVIYLFLLIALINDCHAWIQPLPSLVVATLGNNERNTPTGVGGRCSSSRAPPSRRIVSQARNIYITSTSLCATLPEGYREYGEERILSAASLCGASKDQITIEWKGGRIVVTVSGNVYVSDPLPLVDDDDDDDEAAQEQDTDLSNPKGAVDLSTLARMINSALDDEGVGLAIAEAHEIEVTTPGASDELSGSVMFDAYRGFPVLVQHKDPKKDMVKTIEGKLVERTDDFTIVNVKGRMKKMKNQNVLSVKLPKAKKEKGVR